MNRYTQFILTVIAVGLIALNIQLFKDDIVSKANATESHMHNQFEIIGFKNHDHSANEINNIEDHEHEFRFHAHNTAQVRTGLEGDQNDLKNLLEYLINNNHTHFWK